MSGVAPDFVYGGCHQQLRLLGSALGYYDYACVSCGAVWTRRNCCGALAPAVPPAEMALCCPACGVSRRPPPPPAETPLPPGVIVISTPTDSAPARRVEVPPAPEKTGNTMKNKALFSTSTAVRSCSSCGRPIWFAPTITGGTLPLHAEPDGTGRVAIRDGLARVLGPSAAHEARGVGEVLWTLHEVPCLHAEEHRAKAPARGLGAVAEALTKTFGPPAIPSRASAFAQALAEAPEVPEPPALPTPSPAPAPPASPRPGAGAHLEIPELPEPDGWPWVLLVDVRGVYYRVGYAEATRNYQPGPATARAVVREVARIHLAVVDALEVLSSTVGVLIVDDGTGPTWRHRRFPAYKANRPPSPAWLPGLVEASRQALADAGYGVCWRDGWEADDVLATVATRAVERGKHVIIASPDKDLLQLVGDEISVYRPSERALMDTAAVLAEYGVHPSRLVDYFTLCGDASDGIPGVRGIGPKGAQQLVSEHKDIESILAAIVARESKIASWVREHSDEVRLYAELVELREYEPSLAETCQALGFEYTHISRRGVGQSEVVDLRKEGVR